MAASSDPPASAEWLSSPEEQEGLTRFVQTLRERRWLILGVVAATLAIAILYLLTATKVYEAEADLLVSPVSGTENTAFVIAGLPQESADPTRDVETAARLATTLNVAERVVDELETGESPRELLEKVRAEPVAQSDIVAITASESTPEAAQELANTFAKEAVAQRTDQMHEQIDSRLPALEESLESSGSADTTELQNQISQLQILRSGPDPTIQVETLADTPTAPVSPRPVLSIAAGLLAGLILGLVARLRLTGARPAPAPRGAAAPALPAADPRADPARDAQPKGDRPLDPKALSPVEPRGVPDPARDALGLAAAGSDSSVILVTGPSPHRRARRRPRSTSRLRCSPPASR